MGLGYWHLALLPTYTRGGWQSQDLRIKVKYTICVQSVHDIFSTTSTSYGHTHWHFPSRTLAEPCQDLQTSTVDDSNASKMIKIDNKVANQPTLI